MTLLILIMWIVRFVTLSTIDWTMWLCCGLGCVNSAVLIWWFSQVGITNLLYIFPCLSLQFIYAAASPQLLGAWRGQVIILTVLIVWLAVSKIDYHQETVNTTFFCSLLICLTAFIFPYVLLLLVFVIARMWIKDSLTLRSINALLVAVVTVAVLCAIGLYLGWLPSFSDWGHGISMPDWLTILITIITNVIVFLMYRMPSVVFSIVWLVWMALGLTNFCLFTFTDFL